MNAKQGCQPVNCEGRIIILSELQIGSHMTTIHLGIFQQIIKPDCGVLRNSNLRTDLPGTCNWSMRKVVCLILTQIKNARLKTYREYELQQVLSSDNEVAGRMYT